jgi:hypothetical protein
LYLSTHAATPQLEPAAPFGVVPAKASQGGDPMLTTILIIVLILALIGALPTWGYSRSWGYGPGGGLGLILLIIIVLALTGHM